MTTSPVNHHPGEVVSVAVPQLNNGVPTLVVFAVPSAALTPGVEPDFDQAIALSLGPPLVLTVHDFDMVSDELGQQ